MKTELIFRLAKYIDIYFLRFTIIFIYYFACPHNLNIKEI